VIFSLFSLRFFIIDIIAKVTYKFHNIKDNSITKSLINRKILTNFVYNLLIKLALNKNISSSSDFLQNFEKDKNVLLKTAQDAIFHKLAKRLVEITIEKYARYFNPLGLIDDTYRKILDYQYDDVTDLNGIYENLCVAYRYKHGDNQLEIIWDGRSHEEVYQDEWSIVFDSWVNDLTENHSLIKGVLQLTVFNEDKKNTFFIRNAIKGFINDYFEIKILKRNGIKRVVIKENKLRKAS
jgi:hypothetical protein